MKQARPKGGSTVFLLGAPRSGTSLLYKAMCLHPDVAWFSNWSRRLPSVAPVAVVNRLARRLPEVQRRVWFGHDNANAYVYGRTRSAWERAFPQPVEAEPIYERAGFRAGVETPDERAIRALRQAFDRQRRWAGGACVVSKRIANNRRIPGLLAAFPDAKFVDLLRDGRAVAYSLSRVDWWEDTPLWWYGGTPQQWAGEGRDPLELCARDWVEERGIIERGLASVPPDQVLRVTYESFVSEPATTLEAVAAFAELGVDPAWRRAVGELQYPNRNDGWRAKLDERAARTIETIQQDALEAYGYAL